MVRPVGVLVLPHCERGHVPSSLDRFRSRFVVIVVTAGTILALDESGVEYGLVYGLVLTAVNAVMLGIFLLILDRGRVLSGGYNLGQKRAHARTVARFHKEEFEVGTAGVGGQGPGGG